MIGNLNSDRIQVQGAMLSEPTSGMSVSKLPRSGALKSECERRQGGFTLVELLVVMTILVLLAGIVAPRVIGYVGASKLKAATIQVESLTTALELFRLDAGRYPTTEEGLVALVRKPANGLTWHGPYLRSKIVPTDPWGAAFHYRSPGQNGAFDVFSFGADGKQGGEGENRDIVNW